MVKGVFDNAMSATPKKSLLGWYQRRRNSCKHSLRRKTSISNRIKLFALCSMVWVPTVLLVQTKTQSRLSVTKLISTLRVISFTTQRKPVRSLYLTCVFGPEPIGSPYLITRANFVAVHQTVFIEKMGLDQKTWYRAVLFLINSPYSKRRSLELTSKNYSKKLSSTRKSNSMLSTHRKLPKKSGMGRRINTVMQVCFFAISGVLPRQEAIDAIKRSIKKNLWQKKAMKLLT